MLKQYWARMMAAVCALLMLVAPATAAEDAQAVIKFFASFESFQADFEQSTYDQNGRLLQKQRGQAVILRPGRFRWDYQSPYEQLIIADGEKVWLYDIDLEQVTVKAQDASLGNTPIQLLSRGDGLTDNFDIAFVKEWDGLEWYRLTPKEADGSFDYLSLGMADGILQRMELLDSFGQMTGLIFDQVQINGDIDMAVFKFSPPADVDVIDETL